MKKKLDKGKTPIIEDGYIHVGKVELQPAITYSTCLDCERLKTKLRPRLSCRECRFFLLSESRLNNRYCGDCINPEVGQRIWTQEGTPIVTDDFGCNYGKKRR